MNTFMMMQLKDICCTEKGSIISGPFGSNISSRFFVKEGIPVIRGNNLKLGMTKFIDEGFVFVTEKKAKQLNTYARKNDIIFTAAGTIGQVGIIPSNSKYPEYVISNKQLRVTIDEKKANPLYVFYWLSQPVMERYIMNLNTGSTIPLINLSIIKALPVSLPSMEVQNKIVSILEIIDAKINNNVKINENLQEQAQTIYYHMITENADASWTTGVLSDISIITMGQSPKGESYNEEGCGTVFFQGRAEFGFRFPTRRLYTTEPKRLARTNDALMSVRAPVGDMNVAFENCCIGRGLAAIRSKAGHSSFVLYTMFALREQLNVFNGEGTVFGSINRDALNSMPVDIPPKEIINQFEDIVAPMDAPIRNNYDEICRLQTMRDSLLPKLMSGELDVSDIEL